MQNISCVIVYHVLRLSILFTQPNLLILRNYYSRVVSLTKKSRGMNVHLLGSTILPSKWFYSFNHLMGKLTIDEYLTALTLNHICTVCQSTLLNYISQWKIQYNTDYPTFLGTGENMSDNPCCRITVPRIIRHFTSVHHGLSDILQ